MVIGRKGLTYRSADLRPAAVIGLLDAGANALFALALTRGSDEHGRGHRLAVLGHDGGLGRRSSCASVRARLQGLGVAGVLVGVGLVVAWGGG